MMKEIKLVVLALALAGAVPCEAAPSFAGLVEAVECRPRSGIGHVMEKINAGKPVAIAYFGGSITEMDGWRRLSREWLQSKYPSARFSEIQAAIGGTGSPLGVYRFGQDVMAKNPDLVFVEFATNDSSASPEEIWRNFDGFIRQAWQANPEIDFIFVYTITQAMKDDYLAGRCPRAASAMEQLADYYGIPSVGFGPRVIEDVRSGRLVWTLGEFATAVPVETPDRDNEIIREMESQGKVLFSKDGVHPVASGHAYYLESLKASWPSIEQLAAVDHSVKLAAPFYEATMEKAKMVQIAPGMLTGAWREVEPNEKNGNFASRFGAKPWLTETPGSKMSFRFKGSSCTIYDLVGPACGQILVTVDGVRRQTPVARFDHYCTYYRVATLGVHSGKDAVHTVELELDVNQPDRTGVKVQGVTDEELASAKYDGTEWFAGRIMLVGDIYSDEPPPPKETSAWFDADVESYASWPRDAARAVRGTWSVDGAELADVAGVRASGGLEVFSGAKPLVFTADESVSLGSGVGKVVFTSDLVLDGYEVDELPEVDPSWKGAVVVGVKDGAARYYGLRRVGDANVWTPLEGVSATFGAMTRLEMSFSRRGGQVCVSYALDGAMASVGGETSLPVLATSDFSEVLYGGYGEINSLSGESVSFAPGFQIRICRN